MSLLLLFVVVLVVVFAVVATFTQPTRSEKLAHSRLHEVAGRASADAAQKVDILRHDAYSTIPWLNQFFGNLTPAARLRKLIIEAGLNWTVGVLLLGSLVAFFGVYWISILFGLNRAIAPIVALVAFLSPYSFLYLKRKRQFQKFSAILPDAMDLVSRALRAGHSLTAALDLVGQEIADPVGKEFRRVSEEQNLGLPLRDALLNLAERVPIPDVRFLVAAMLIQRETGGNLVEVLDKTTSLLRDRIRLQGEVRIYTAQGRLTGWILCLLPIFMFFALTAINPNYTAPLLTEPTGQHLLVAGCVLMLLGILVIRKIIQIKGVTVLYIVITAGLTIFFATTLLIVIFERRSSAEARLLDAVQGIKPIVTTPAFRPATIVTEISSATERLRHAVGITDTTSAARQLLLAGYRQPFHVEMFYAVRLLLPAITAVLISLFIHEDVIFWFIIGTIFAFYVPDLFVSRLIRQRRERVRLGLPDALDLLAICMEAGLGLDQALLRVGAELNDTHPDLSDEFNLISLEQRAGTPRIEAWRHMAERTKLEIISSFVSMLVQTDRFGTPISKALAVFSDSLRTQRRQKAEELAAKTTIKMVFPLVFFIFPSMFIVLLAPAFLSIIRNMQTLF